MADVWIAYTTILETVMARMQQTCLEDRDRYVLSHVMLMSGNDLCCWSAALLTSEKKFDCSALTAVFALVVHDVLVCMLPMLCSTYATRSIPTSKYAATDADLDYVAVVIDLLHEQNFDRVLFVRLLNL